MKKTFTAAAVLSLFVWQGAQADDAQIQSKLSALGITNAQIKPSPLAGMKTVLSDSGVLYVSDNGEFILQGPMFQLTGQQPVNVTNQLLMEQLAKMDNEMIVYKAKDQKYVVTVFTDTTCGYCRKLHDEMKEYNDLGITVRYLAFPRYGIGSNSANQMAGIWAAADRKQAFSDAMAGKEVPAQDSKASVIAQQFTLGHQFGVQGTPAILLPNGDLLPGYRDPKGLQEVLKAYK
ncbi:MAG: bifunctional protein-disulfide isomerase/oxidoreductase DsbC [Plesiomonas shigelloides]